MPGVLLGWTAKGFRRDTFFGVLILVLSLADTIGKKVTQITR